MGWALAGGAHAADPVIGMIFPPANYPTPPEAKLLYPTGVTFLSKGVGLPGGLTEAGYDEAMPRVFAAAAALKAEGAQGISVMGTSLTFYKGAAFEHEIKQRVTRETGLPATTMSSGIVAGLTVAGARRIAIATAYSDVITERLKRFLEESGFQVATAKGMGFTAQPGEHLPAAASSPEGVAAFSAEVYESGPRCDALVISCGGLKTIDILAPLEARLKVPVVSSTPHALMDAVRLVGRSGRAEGFGQVLAKA